MKLWKENPVLRGALYALGAVALVALLAHLRRPAEPSPVAPAIDNKSAGLAPSQATTPAGPPRMNSHELQAHCQPELNETPPVPTFEIDDQRFVRVAVSLKARFLVDKDGFVTNAYVTGSTVVTAQDQEAAIDYVRHLTFRTQSAEECESVKVEMVGDFHMSKDSTGDWITTFDTHPVYSFSGNQLVVKPI